MNHPFRSTAALALLVAALAPACSSKKPAGGTPLVRAAARELYLSPDGKAVATLIDAGPPSETTAPRDVLVGALAVAPVDGSAPARTLGGGVTNLPGALLFSPTGGRVAFLSGWSFSRGSGSLRLASLAGGEAREVAQDVTFYAFSGAGDRLAWVANGELFTADAEGQGAKSVSRGVSMFEWGPAGTPAAGRILVKRFARAGGALLLHDIATGELKAVAHGVASFGFAPDGRAFGFQAQGLLAPDQVGDGSALGGARLGLPQAPGFYVARGEGAPERVLEDGASDFRFLPDGRVALLTAPPPGRTTGDLLVLAAGAAPGKVAGRVSRIAAVEGALVVLGAWDDRSNLGTLGVLRPDGQLAEVSRNVKDFAPSPAGRYLLMTQTKEVEGHPSMVLAVHPVLAPPDSKARFVDSGVFGYTADREEKRLAYKARCMDEGRACSLFVTDLESATKPVLVAARVAAFDFLPDGSALLVVTSRRASKTTGQLVYSLGLVPLEGGPKANTEIVPLDDVVGGDFVFAQGGRVAYTVNDAARPGVYVLDPKRPAGAK